MGSFHFTACLLSDQRKNFEVRLTFDEVTKLWKVIAYFLDQPVCAL